MLNLTNQLLNGLSTGDYGPMKMPAGGGAKQSASLRADAKRKETEALWRSSYVRRETLALLADGILEDELRPFASAFIIKRHRLYYFLVTRADKQRGYWSAGYATADEAKSELRQLLKRILRREEDCDAIIDGLEITEMPKKHK